MLRRPSCGGLFKTVFSGDGFLLGRCSICPSNTVHPAAAAFRTDTDVNVPYRFQEFCHGKASVFFPETLTPLKRKDQLQVFAFPTVVQEPIIADFLKAMRKHMHQITADEFRVIQSDPAFWVAGLFPTGGKDSLLSVNGKDPAVGDGNLMCIPESRGVHQGQDGLMLEIGKSLDKIPYLLLGRDIGKKRIKSAHRELCGVPWFMQDVYGKKAKLRNAMVYGAVRKILFFLNPADEIAQFLPGNIFRVLVEKAGKIIQIGTDISGIGFYSMVCKAAEGDHLPKLF